MADVRKPALFNVLDIPRAPRPEELPTDEDAFARIKDVLRAGTEAEYAEGMNWYFTAHAIAAAWTEQYSLPSVDHTAGIIAALSPQKPWELNLRLAEILLQGNDIGHLAHAKGSALAIRAGDHPHDVLYDPKKNNPKVRAFYENIANPFESTAVTVDRHVMGVLLESFRAIQSLDLYIKPHENTWAQRIFKETADSMGVMPHQLQAITWVIWKRLRGDKPSVRPQVIGQMTLEYTDPLDT